MIYFDRYGHLISSKSLEELHAFAEKIGLRREWFQYKDKQSHYDLCRRDKENQRIYCPDLGWIDWDLPVKEERKGGKHG